MMKKFVFRIMYLSRTNVSWKNYSIFNEFIYLKKNVIGRFRF